MNYKWKTSICLTQIEVLPKPPSLLFYILKDLDTRAYNAEKELEKGKQNELNSNIAYKEELISLKIKYLELLEKLQK